MNQRLTQRSRQRPAQPLVRAFAAAPAALVIGLMACGSALAQNNANGSYARRHAPAPLPATGPAIGPAIGPAPAQAPNGVLETWRMRADAQAAQAVQAGAEGNARLNRLQAAQQAPAGQPSAQTQLAVAQEQARIAALNADTARLQAQLDAMDAWMRGPARPR